jgi:hypothetical protein
VSKTNNIIEINGKRYDAHTGAALDHAAHGSPRTAPQPTVKHHAKKTSRPMPKHAAAHTPQPSKTLMRRAVSKPARPVKPRFKAHGHTDALIKKPAAELSVKPSVNRLDTQRLKYAKRVPKSKLVRKFAPGLPTTYVAPAMVRPMAFPMPPEALVDSAPPVSHGTEAILERALAAATSHQQPRHKAPRRKASHITGVSVASLVAIAIVAVVLNGAASLRLHNASSKAGFAIGVPGYKPAGFHMEHLQYSAGIAALNFKGNVDDRSFTVTEKPSNWDSTALRDNFVAAQGQIYQTAQSGGRTIYLYGQHSATWVSGGLWYQVQAADALSDRQLIDLASSL